MELRKEFKTDTVSPINIETIEEAAYDASHWKVNAADLIHQSTRVMKSAKKDI